MSIGSRSQSARTYLEKVLNELEGSDRSTLIKHGLIALRETLPADQVCKILRFYTYSKILFLLERTLIEHRKSNMRSDYKLQVSSLRYFRISSGNQVIFRNLE